MSEFYDFENMTKKFDYSSAPLEEWNRRMLSAMDEAFVRLLYALDCAKSIGDMEAAGVAETLSDRCYKASNRFKKRKTAEKKKENTWKS